MSNFSFTTPDGRQWTAIDRGEFYRYEHRKDGELIDVLYDGSLKKLFPDFVIPN